MIIELNDKEFIFDQWLFQLTVSNLKNGNCILGSIDFIKSGKNGNLQEYGKSLKSMLNVKVE